MLNKIIITTLVLLTWVNAIAQKRLQQVFYREPDNYHSLYMYDLQEQVSKKIYETPPKFGFLEYKLSPTKNLVAFLETNGEHMRPGDLGYAIQNLVILESTGKVLTRVEQVLHFAWSPSGDSVAFIRGYDYGGMELKTKGVWLLDLSNSFKQIKVSDEKASDISWASHNGKIYTRWKDIYEIDLLKRTTRKTNLKGMFFSPDGKHYFRPNYEGTGFQLFETESNIEITPKGMDKERVNFYLWLSNSNLIVGDVTFEKRIIEAQTGRILRSLDGYVLDYEKKKQELIVYKDKRDFKSLAQSTFEQIKVE